MVAASGFNSHSHLSRQFRQATGMTPKAYRAS
ncbi:MAG: AraC family transcriptional regulator [Phormidesmis sp.]